MEIKWELQDTLLLRNTDFWRTKQTGCWTSARDTQQGGESQWEKYQFKDKSVKEETHQLVIADARINISRQTVWRKTQSSCLKRKTHTHWCYRINKCYHICIICCCVVCINSAGLQNSLQHSEGYTRRSLSCRWDDISHIWKKGVNTEDFYNNFREILKRLTALKIQIPQRTQDCFHCPVQFVE